MKFSFTIVNNIKELYTLHQQLLKVQARWKLPPKSISALNLMLDELVTNIIEHGDPNKKHLIEIHLEKKQTALIIQVIDDGPAFDPTVCSTPDINLSLENRKCGGLGILLVRRLSDCCSYSRANDKNILTLTKNLPTDDSDQEVTGGTL